jgi:hypothetical protein
LHPLFLVPILLLLLMNKAQNYSSQILPYKCHKPKSAKHEILRQERKTLHAFQRERAKRTRLYIPDSVFIIFGET